MRFYNQQHRHYCGIDLHVKTMYVCILDGSGHVLVHRNVPATPAVFREIVAPYRDGLVVGRRMYVHVVLARGRVRRRGHSVCARPCAGDASDSRREGQER